MNYTELPEFESVQIDTGTLRSLLDRPGDQRRRIVEAIVRLRQSLQELSRAIEKLDGIQS